MENRTRGMKVSGAGNGSNRGSAAAAVRGITVNNAGCTENGPVRGMKVLSVPDNSGRGLKIVARIPCSQSVANFVSTMQNKDLNKLLNNIEKLNVGGALNTANTRRAKVLNIYNKVTALKNKGGASPFVGAYYIDAHGVCSRMPKFTIPFGRAIIFMSRARTTLNAGLTNVAEAKYMTTKEGVRRFISGSARENGLNNLDFKSRAYYENESVYDQWIGIPPNRPNAHTIPMSPPFTTSTGQAFLSHLGSSSGHVWKLPLKPGHNRNNIFSYNGNNMSRVLNLKMFKSRTGSYKNNKAGFYKLSDIVATGPPGVYIVATCREFANNTKTNRTATGYSRGTTITNVVSASNNTTVRNQLAMNIINNLKRQARKRREARGEYRPRIVRRLKSPYTSGPDPKSSRPPQIHQSARSAFYIHPLGGTQSTDSPESVNLAPCHGKLGIDCRSSQRAGIFWPVRPGIACKL